MNAARKVLSVGSYLSLLLLRECALGAAGYEVTSADNVPVALGHLTTQQFDAVVLCPFLEATQLKLLVNTTRRHFPQIPILLVSQTNGCCEVPPSVVHVGGLEALLRALAALWQPRPTSKTANPAIATAAVLKTTLEPTSERSR